MYLEWLREEYRKKGEVYKFINQLAHKHIGGEDIFLVCFCKPKSCHGDIVKRAIESVAARIVMDAEPANQESLLNVRQEDL
jgi:hypothetical protein